MNLTLVVQQGRKQVLPIRSAEAVIGRAAGCSVRIPSSQVSRRHCRLRVSGEGVTVEDLGSVNGTYLNGELVTGEPALTSGDQLSVGPVTFLVQLGEGAAKGGAAESDYPPLVPLGPNKKGPSQPEPETQPNVDIDAGGQPWRLPEPGQFRDFLIQLDESAESPEQ
jgi:pSer/pThr/pTyr-binding forkhead associated (FHA) protein